MHFQKFARVLSLKEVLAALENLKRFSATKDDTDAFVLLCFQYLTHRLSIVGEKSSPVKQRPAIIDVEKQ